MIPSNYILAFALLALAWIIFTLSKKYTLVKKTPVESVTEFAPEVSNEEEKKDS